MSKKATLHEMVGAVKQYAQQHHHESQWAEVSQWTDSGIQEVVQFCSSKQAAVDAVTRMLTQSWVKERMYCLALNMENIGPGKYIVKTTPDVYIQFFDDHWEFWSSGIKVYQSKEDNLSYCLENGSATSATCPICGYWENDGCAAYYFEDNNVTVFWNCNRDLKGNDHHLAVYGYCLDERDHVKQLQKNLNIGTVKGQFKSVDEIREMLKGLKYYLVEDQPPSRYEIWQVPGDGGWPGPPPDPTYYCYIDKARLLVFFGHESFVPEDYMYFPKENE